MSALMPPAISQLRSNPSAALTALTRVETGQMLRGSLGIQRQPGRYDDASRGYAIGDLWLAPAGAVSRVFQAKAVGVGAARWAPVLVGTARPLDLAPTAKLALGTVKLRTAYTGNALNVIRASDSTTLDIGFLPDGRLDAPALATFLVGTTGKVVTWYDQSGNGNDVTQATDANRPLIDADNINGHVTVQLLSDVPGAGASASTIVTKWLMNSTATATPSTTTFLGVSRARAAKSKSNGVVVFGNGGAGVPGTSSPFLAGVGGSTPGLQIVSLRSTNVPPESGPMVYGYRNNSNSAEFAANNQTASAGNPAAATALQTGITCGDPAFSANAEHVAWVLWDRVLTAAEYLNARAALHILSGVAPQGMDVVVGWGDSITFGWGATSGRSRMVQDLPLYQRPVRQYNIGVPATTIVTEITNQASSVGMLYSARGSTAPRFVVVLSIGTNDLFSSSRTAAQLWTDFQTACAYLRTLGSNVRIVVTSIPPRTTANASAQTERTTFNAAISAGWAGIADAFVDLASDPIMGAGQADTTLYLDGLHPTALGYSYLAQAVGPAVAELLAA